MTNKQDKKIYNQTYYSRLKKQRAEERRARQKKNNRCPECHSLTVQSQAAFKKLCQARRESKLYQWDEGGRNCDDCHLKSKVDQDFLPENISLFN